MEQWEYLPTYLKAEASSKEIKEFLQAQIPDLKNPPRYMAEAMMPQLNALGRQGWELVHMEPVQGVGRKGDALFDGGGLRWSNVYFCVFKRRRIAAPPRPSAPPSAPPK
jgi:hypothetical protein